MSVAQTGNPTLDKKIEDWLQWDKVGFTFNSEVCQLMHKINCSRMRKQDQKFRVS